MIIKLFHKDIDDNRFYLMIADTLDAFINTNDSEFIEKNVFFFTERLKQDIEQIIDEVAYDWIEDNTKS